VDFFAENLWPFEVRDERILDFELPPQKSVPPTQVIQNAEQLRGEAQRGLMTPQVQSCGVQEHLQSLHRSPGR
jgi:hypothetical protein